MISSTWSDLPCFRFRSDIAIDQLRNRLYPLGINSQKMTKAECHAHADQLI